MSVRGTTRGRKVRVAHVGTGATGQQALKGIIGHPDLELVSLWVSTPDKVGRDAGELVGMDGVGIAAVGSLEEALASEARRVELLRERARSGRLTWSPRSRRRSSAASTSSTISLLGMLYPPAGPATLREPLEAAAAKGGSTFLSTGLDPGFSSDLLPMALLTMSDTVEHVLVQEIGIYDHYDVEPVIRGIMGFGHPPSYEAPIASGGAFVAFWGPMVRQLADRMGVELDEVVGTDDFAVHDADLNTSVGLMEAGTVVARRVACEGRVAGRTVITAEHITRMAAEVAPDWPRFDGVGESNYRIVIDGKPIHALRSRSGPQRRRVGVRQRYRDADGQPDP